MTATCAYLAGDGWTECGRPAERGVSARHRSSDRWSTWPACAHHAEPLARDLAGGPFVVTAAYDLADDAERERLEDFADRVMPAS